MGFWDIFKPATFKNDSPLELDTFGFGENNHKLTYPDYTKFVKLQHNTFILKNVLSKIGSKVSSVKFVCDNENEPLFKLLNNPNTTQSKEEFLKEFTVFILSAGWTAVYKKYGVFGDNSTLELVNLNPDCSEVKEDVVTTVINGKMETFLKSDVILFFDSIRNENLKKGYSRIAPLRSQIKNIQNAQIAKGIQIDNSGTIIISPKQVTGSNNIDEGLNAPVPQIGGNLVTQKQEIENKFSKHGLMNRFIVSSKGIEAKNLSSEFNKMDFYKVIESDALDIYDAYNFPAELTPYGKNATFENKPLAEISLMENEVFPLLENIIRSFSLDFNPKNKISADFNHLNSMSVIHERTQKTNQTIIDQYGYLFEKELIDKNEFIKILQSKKILE